MVALLLGCIGVASSVFIYVKSKYNSIALLRCIGMKSDDAFLVYFIQIMSLGLLAVISGVIAGVLIQSLLPLILKDFCLFRSICVFRQPQYREGFAIGLVVTSFVSLIPLVNIRSVSPLEYSDPRKKELHHSA
ncbi:MAG: FtsX-like permease family protein [Saprospiraceae bacterium]|nr:FtsX-like permease family protein [Saprospiraceae bacterium]